MIESRKSVSKEELETLRKDVAIANEELSAANTASKKGFEELSKICSQTRKLKNYVEKSRTSDDYQELEHIVRDKVGKLLANNRKYLENVLVSLVCAVRNDPDRYLLIDSLTSFAPNTFVNYDPQQALYQPRYEQFVRESIRNC